MSTTTYQPLPPDRTWSPETERLAQALLATAGGDRLEVAALGLLFADASVIEGEDLRRYVHIHTHDDAPADVDVDWPALSAAADDDDCYDNDAWWESHAALIRVACAIASPTCVVNLGMLARLDEFTHLAVLDAFAYAMGRGES